MIGIAGVLAIQGDVREHQRIIESLSVQCRLVKTAEDLERVDALVIPGGESSTIGFLLDEHDMIDLLRKRIEAGMGAFGTCAGAILLADQLLTEPGEQEWPRIGGLDIAIQRNAYGRQVESFESDIDVEGIGEMHAVFIRAPVIDSVGADVDVLSSHRDRPVVVRQGNMFAATFHPELSDDVRLHEYFLKEVAL